MDSEAKPEDFAPLSSTGDASGDSNLPQAEAVDAVDNAESNDVAVAAPRFAELEDLRQTSESMTLDHFYDVNVRVWAELGNVTMPISDLMELGEGAVLKLTRPISEPVDLVAQGVKLARGEVVVVDDCFAIRITEIGAAEKSRD